MHGVEIEWIDFVRINSQIESPQRNIIMLMEYKRMENWSK